MLISSNALKICRRATGAIFLAGVSFFTGCHPFKGVSAPPQPIPSEVAAKPIPPATSTSDALEVTHPGLASDEWFRTVTQPGSVNPPAHRWHNPKLAELLATPAARRPDLTSALASDQPVVAANAAIVLARWGSESAAQPLAAAVRAAPLALRLRSAAAEALAELPEGGSGVRELVAEYGRFEGEDAVAYLPQLHAELLLVLALSSARGEQAEVAAPLATAALASPAAEVRLAALGFWQQPGAGELPEAAADLRSDPESRVRAAALAAIASRPSADAVEYAIAGMADYALEVRLSAIAALGELGGEQAVEQLNALLKHDGERDRAAAVSALARLGQDEPVRSAVGDQAWTVRCAVAESLGELPTRRAPNRRDTALAEELLDDRSGEVQKSVVAALESWPLEQAGPLLLAALEDGPYLRRKLAAAQLAKRWPAAKAFSVEAPADRRVEALASLKQAWRAEPVKVDPAVTPATHVVAQPVTGASTADLDRVAALVSTLADSQASRPAQATAQRELEKFGDDLPTLLEGLVLDRGVTLPEAVYRGALAKVSGEFTALDRLCAEEATERRRGAEQLRQWAAKTPLRPLATARLAALAAEESDPLVMRSLFTAVARDAGEPAARLAYAALSHPDDEIRRLGCEHLAAHPSAAHERLLLPALADENPLVVSAAVRALGDTGRITQPATLAPLLAHADRGVRVEAAAALVRLGSPTGAAALERLTLDSDARIRRRAVQMMGELRDPTFTATLIGLLDESEGVGAAALANLPRVAGREMKADNDSERVRLWKAWWGSRTQEVDEPAPRR